MAYDQHGNYYFDPNIDEEDRELVADEARRKQARDFVEQQSKAAKEQQDLNKMWAETLESEGLDFETYSELYNSDPDTAKRHLKAAMRQVAANIKRGRDAAGRSSAKGKGVQQRREQPDPRQTLDAMHEKAKTGPLSEEDEMSVLDALFGTEPL